MSTGQGQVTGKGVTQASEEHFFAGIPLRCRDPQCVAFDHTCPGCGNDLHGDNFCMVSACEQEV